MNSRNLILCCLLIATIGRAASTNDLPKFDEVVHLLNANLNGETRSDLDRAAVKGLLSELHGQATLVEDSDGKASPSRDVLPKTAIYDNAFAYFRIGSVSSDLPEKFHAAYRHLVETNKTKIKGVILDLRFAGGDDYAAAAATADFFLNSDHPLLDWGTGSAIATKKEDAIKAPVAILVNGETRGAAEALAAALREEEIGLVLGATTAGQASIFKDFPLQGGGTLRIATSDIKLGDGAAMAHGLKPDIAVQTDAADEKAYLKDPYKVLHPVAVKMSESSNSATTLAAPRRFNEAELVRERRLGVDLEGEIENGGDSAPEPAGPPTINDPTLARALDLLKGLAVIQESRPG